MITWRVGFWYYTDLRTHAEVDAFTWEQALAAAFVKCALPDWPRDKGFKITIEGI